MKKAFTFNPLGSYIAWTIIVLVREYFPGNTDKNVYWIDGNSITDANGNPVEGD